MSVFSIYHEGSYQEHASLKAWVDEQLGFDDAQDVLYILQCMHHSGSADWAGNDYQVQDAAAFDRQYARQHARLQRLQV